MAINKKYPKGKRSSPGGGKLGKLKILFGLGLLSVIIIIAIFQYILYLNPNQDPIPESQLEPVISDLGLAVKPFKGDSFPLDQIFGNLPVWGTLNSGHYFGLKLSSPDSIETSLIWFENNQYGRLNMRHLCDQNDKLNSYSWISHDFHSFGVQTIEDNLYRINTSFLINTDNKFEWTARVDLEYSNNTRKPDKPLSFIQYLATNHQDDTIQIESYSSNKEDVSKDGQVFKLKGHTRDIGNYEMSIILEDKGHTGKFIFGSYLVGKMNRAWFPVSEYLNSRMMIKQVGKSRYIVLPGPNGSKFNQYEDQRLINSNIAAYQIILSAPTSFTIKFRQSNEPYETQHHNHKAYNDVLEAKLEEFDSNFVKSFPVDKLKLKSNFSEFSIKKLAKVALSNMIGSVGYFYGNSYIGSDLNPHKIAPYGPIQLLTGVPSRSFFPRGFLWDEGFHNLLIMRWDSGLSNKIIRSWFDIMNVNGWIPREVILGIESMRRVPQDFRVQKISNANPPAMFVVIEKMMDSGLLEESTFESIYPKLKAWYNWFNVTQSGLQPGTYRWRGRDKFSVSMLNPKTLTSGLDDYPRSSHPSPDEYHIDLRCWMALAARTLAKLAERKGDLRFLEQISREAQSLIDNRLLNDLHWSEEHRMFCDFGHNTEKAELVLVTKTRHNADRLETYQVLERHSKDHPKFGCVPEFGYVSLFPMLLNVLDHRSEKLGIILSRLRDEDELWSPYGIRSLSKSSRYYNKDNTQDDRPYWRGAVWLNLNYLILSSLKTYSNLEGPYKERCFALFLELKENLITNVLREFERTNYLWENYDDKTGRGKGSHPFTGWSSLILLIMSD